MKEFSVGPNDAGQRLDRFVGKTVPLLPESLLQKYIRIKRIKVCALALGYLGMSLFSTSPKCFRRRLPRHHQVHVL